MSGSVKIESWWRWTDGDWRGQGLRGVTHSLGAVVTEEQVDSLRQNWEKCIGFLNTRRCQDRSQNFVFLPSGHLCHRFITTAQGKTKGDALSTRFEHRFITLESKCFSMGSPSYPPSPQGQRLATTSWLRPQLRLLLPVLHVRRMHMVRMMFRMTTACSLSTRRCVVGNHHARAV